MVDLAGVKLRSTYCVVGSISVKEGWELTIRNRNTTSADGADRRICHRLVSLFKVIWREQIVVVTEYYHLMGRGVSTASTCMGDTRLTLAYTPQLKRSARFSFPEGSRSLSDIVCRIIVDQHYFAGSIECLKR